MKQLDQNKWCPLGYLVEPLQLLTDHLKTKVNTMTGMVTHVQQNKKDGWLLEINHANIIMGKRVILATGSSPKRLTLNGPQEIPLDIAFNPSALKDWIQPGDTVAIFGNAHSGILAIKNVSALPVKHIYNFYKTPVLYAQRRKGKLFNNFRGIKSATAEWAKNNLDKRNNNLVTTVQSNEENIKNYICMCDKVIYAIGFEPNKIVGIHSNTGSCIYDETTGMIAPGLFGLGIAFPEGYTDAAGLWEHRVGLMSFLTYAKKMVPTWLKS
jgi:thioredoxin reductase